MLRWYPMARAVPYAGGNRIVYDLTALSYLTRVLPDYQPVVRDLENVRWKIRRKKFGTRPTASLAFDLPHRGTLNSLARWYEIDGLNLLQNPYNLTLAPWSLSNATTALSPAKDPVGTFTATRLTDSSGAQIGLLFQNTGVSAAGFTGRFTFWARADVPHPFSIGLQDNGAQGIDLDVDAEFGWTRVEARLSFTNTALNFQGMIRATQFVASLQGNVDLYLPSIQKIVALPGTDEEILADLKDKLSSDDWLVELTLDGGLSWREVLLREHQKFPIEDKWVGTSETFSFVAVDVIQSVPALLDGRW